MVGNWVGGSKKGYAEGRNERARVRGGWRRRTVSRREIAKGGAGEQAGLRRGKKKRGGGGRGCASSRKEAKEGGGIGKVRMYGGR